MQSKTVITLIALTATAIALSYLIYYVYRLQKPSSGNCDYIKLSNPTGKYSDDCSYIQEISYDSSIPGPTSPIYLNKFTYSSSLGPAWGGINVYY